MANTRERVKDFPSIVGTIQNDDYIPVDGATQGVRKAQVKDIMDAPITGLDTIANTAKGAINELATTAGKVWVGTQAEYDDLPDTKLTDNVLHCITDGEPSAYDSIWDKVGTDPLDTTASDCSGAINEIKSSLSPEEIKSSDGRIIFTRQGKHRLVQFNRAERSVITAFFNSLLATDCPKTFATGSLVMTDSNISPAKYYRLAYAYIEGTTRPSITIVYNSQYNANQGEQVATTATERFIGQVEWYTA